MPHSTRACGPADQQRLVYVVDGDAAARQWFGRAFDSATMCIRLFASADEFLEQCNSGDQTPSCLLLDLHLPHDAALQLQRTMHERGADLPVIMLAEHVDVPAIVEAMRRGAFDVIRRPVHESELVDRVRQALEWHAGWLAERQRRMESQRRLASLTLRERQVLDLILDGLANKQIARRLGLSQKTIELHRSRLMRKMRADSIVGLVRMALLAELPRLSSCSAADAPDRQLRENPTNASPQAPRY